MIMTPSDVAATILRVLVCDDSTDDRTSYEGCAWKPITIMLTVAPARFVVTTVAIVVGTVSATFKSVPPVLTVLIMCSLLFVVFVLNLLDKVWCRLNLNENGSCDDRSGHRTETCQRHSRCT